MSYHVEMDEIGCAECGHGGTWIVVGPDDVATGTSYGDHNEASAMADALSCVYAQGRAAAFKLTSRRAGPADRRASPAALYAGEQRRRPLLGRRIEDDDIPF